jgi:hypothetical protein
VSRAEGRREDVALLRQPNRVLQKHIDNIVMSGRGSRASSSRAVGNFPSKDSLGFVKVFLGFGKDFLGFSKDFSGGFVRIQGLAREKRKFHPLPNFSIRGRSRGDVPNSDFSKIAHLR